MTSLKKLKQVQVSICVSDFLSAEENYVFLI